MFKRFMMVLFFCVLFCTSVSAAEKTEDLPTVGAPEVSVTPVPETSVTPVPEASVTPVPEASETPVPEASETPVPENGWRITSDGRKMYYRNGKYVTGLVTISKKQYLFRSDGYLLIDSWGTVGSKKYHTNSSGVIQKNKLIEVKGKYYYLDPKGIMRTGWRDLKAGKYYFSSSGAAVTGPQKVKGKWYYFNKKGVRQTKTKKVDGTTYYIDDSGYLEARKKGSKYYHADGKAMSSLEAQDFSTLQTAKSIVNKITTSKMSKSQKLRKCFDWVISKYYRTWRRFSNTKGWPAVYANDHFKKGCGNCFSDAAAFAYLAKALGYKKVYVCVDCDGSGGRGHAWAEIDGKVYDPLFAEAKSFSRNYGVKYGVYILHPILHIAV